jgi:hypothetical protein
MTEQSVANIMWPERVSMPKVSLKTDEMFSKLVMFFKRFVYFDDPVFYSLSAIFVIFTYLFDIFDETPYLQIRGPKGSGKTQLGDMFWLLCFNAFISNEISDAAVFRTIAQSYSRGGLTLIVDEADDVAGSTRRGILLRTLKSGYRRNGNVTRCGPCGTIDRFPTFGPKIVINEKGIHDSALESRTIPIHMIKAPSPLEKFQFEKVKKEAKEIKELVRSFSEDYRDLIFDRYFSFKGVEGISNRDEEVWMPIIIIADLLAVLLDSPSIKADMVKLARKIILQRKKTELIGNREVQILAGTQAFIEEMSPLKIDGLPFYIGEDLCKSIKDGWSLPNLKLETVSHVLNQFNIIKGLRRPHLKKKIENSEIQVQRVCYLFDEQRLAELTNEYFEGGEDI